MTTVLIGGTGSLGKELARQIVREFVPESVVIFSRDEFKQHEMRREFPGLQYVLGDVRDKNAVRSAMQDAHTVFLLAAIKHIDAAERNPLEAMKTNINGAVNVAEAAIDLKVKHVVFSNTDKAVLPITTYGYTKALAQNYLLSLNGQSETKFSAFSWGNILASRGSVIPTFVRSLLASKKIRLTHPEMSRFWITIEDAATFMLLNHRKAPPDVPLIPPIKGASLKRIADTIAKILGIDAYETEIVGLRGTEKINEVLLSTHEGCLRSDNCEQYSDADLRKLLAPIVASEKASMTANGDVDDHAVLEIGTRRGASRSKERWKMELDKIDNEWPGPAPERCVW